jgi:aminoglycoside/choline kinase family phosphotransferase
MIDSSLPAMPEGLSAQWLTPILHQAGLRSDAYLIDVRRTGVGDGVGMMSELSRLNLTWSKPGDDLPATMIAKYASTNPMNRAAATGFHVYEREVRYFLEVDARTTARTPRCYYGKLEADNYLLLMDDLGDYRVGSQAAGAGFEDTAIAVDELARLHASFWEKASEFEWVPHIVNSYHADTMITLARAGWDPMVNHFSEHVPEAIRARKDDILAAIPNLQAAMDKGPITLIHGDFRLDNVMFGVKPGHFPAVILDWQGPLLCKGVVDLALLLGQNTHIEVRRQQERNLVQRYVDGLAALGVNYPPATAWEDYLDALTYQWCYAATVTGSLDSSNPRSAAWMRSLVSRQSAATLDHDLLTRLNRFL